MGLVLSGLWVISAPWMLAVVFLLMLVRTHTFSCFLFFLAAHPETKTTQTEPKEFFLIEKA